MESKPPSASFITSVPRCQVKGVVGEVEVGDGDVVRWCYEGGREEDVDGRKEGETRRRVYMVKQVGRKRVPGEERWFSRGEEGEEKGRRKKKKL